MVVVIVRQQQEVDRRQQRRRQAGPGDPLRAEPGAAARRARSGTGRSGCVRPPSRIRKLAWPSQVTLSRAAAPPRCRPAPASVGSTWPSGIAGAGAPLDQPAPEERRASPPRCRRARGCPAGCGRCRRAGGARGACRCPGPRLGTGATRTAGPRAAPAGGGGRCQSRRASRRLASCNRRWCAVRRRASSDGAARSPLP